MFRRRLPQAVRLLTVCVCLALAYNDDFEVDYADSYVNEITDGETPEPTLSPAPCSSPDLTKWDKIFSMLENSQMRENMLLVEMEALRGEMLRFVAQYGGSCGAAVETAGKRMAVQLEGRLRQTLEHFKLGDPNSAAGNSVGNMYHLKAMLEQLLSTAQAQASRLGKLESSCFGIPGSGKGMNAKPGFQLPGGGSLADREQEVTSREASLDTALCKELGVRAELIDVLKSSRQRYLPAGCEMALLFPMRSRRIYTAVLPDVRLNLSSFTVCMWVKPTTMSNKTVLFSYGNRQNPYEIQLLLAQTSALFTIGGEAHLVEARGVVNLGKWVHLCGAWSSNRGLATLWAEGKKLSSTSGVAEGHVLPDGGSLQLGQERKDPLTSSGGSGVTGFEGGFDPKLAFAGKMTGVNMWDRVLSEAEVSLLALSEGHGCQQRGNMVSWGVTEMIPHGGAQFIY